MAPASLRGEGVYSWEPGGVWLPGGYVPDGFGQGRGLRVPGGVAQGFEVGLEGLGEGGGGLGLGGVAVYVGLEGAPEHGLDLVPGAVPGDDVLVIETFYDVVHPDIVGAGVGTVAVDGLSDQVVEAVQGHALVVEDVVVDDGGDDVVYEDEVVLVRDAEAVVEELGEPPRTGRCPG